MILHIWNVSEKSWNVKPFFATGLAKTQVGHAIANIGSLVGGLLSPHHERKNKDKRRGKFGSDDATYDDNIISLTVSYLLSSFQSLLLVHSLKSLL